MSATLQPAAKTGGSEFSPGTAAKLEQIVHGADFIEFRVGDEVLRFCRGDCKSASSDEPIFELKRVNMGMAWGILAFVHALRCTGGEGFSPHGDRSTTVHRAPLGRLRLQ